MANLAGLQNALNVSSGRGSAAVADPSDAPTPRKEPRGPKPTSKTPVPIGRAGRENIAAWLPGDFKKSIRLIQAKKPDQSLQDLMAEAFNDLFSKYNVPTVSE